MPLYGSGGGTPSAHKTSHENGGSDEIDATGLTGAGGGGGGFEGGKAYLGSDLVLTSGQVNIPADMDSQEFDTAAYVNTGTGEIDIGANPNAYTYYAQWDLKCESGMPTEGYVRVRCNGALGLFASYTWTDFIDSAAVSAINVYGGFAGLLDGAEAGATLALEFTNKLDVNMTVKSTVTYHGVIDHGAV